MGLNIKKRRINLVVDKYPLPGLLDADGETATISLEAYATGGINPEYAAAVSEMVSGARAKEIAIDKMGDDEAKYHAKRDLVAWVFRERQAAFFDHCVIKWSTTIFDEDEKGPLAPTRDNFLDLLDMDIKSVSEFFGMVEQMAADRGKEMAEADDKLAKNWNGRS